MITTYKKDLYSFIFGIIIRTGGKVLSINGTSDHIHIAVKLLPYHNISDILRLIKGSSSKWINEEKKSIDHFSWQTGYGAFTISKSKLDSVIRYINSQEQHHKAKTFKEEFIEHLNLHEIEYNERYLWN